MNKTRWLVAGAFVGVAIILVLGADVTTKMFDQTYFSTNQTAISLHGNLTNWSKASTNLASFNGVTNTLGVTSTGLALVRAPSTNDALNTLGLLDNLSATNFVQFIALWGDSMTEGYSPEVSGMFPQIPFLFGGVGGETSTQIRARVSAASNYWNNCGSVIWAGYNNYSDTNTVVTDIAAMVAMVNNGPYCVLSIINGTNQPLGTANYNTITNINYMLSTVYGTNYIDVRSAVIAAYDPGNPQDVIDYANDVPPQSLRASVPHLNANGQLVVANTISNKLASWLTGTNKLKTQGYAMEMNRSQSWGVRNYGESLYLGPSAGASASITDSGNLMIGYHAGRLTTNDNNMAIGADALESNVMGIQNVAVGDHSQFNGITNNNTSIGFKSLYSNTSGQNNTAVGANALYTSIADGNTAIGATALFAGNASYYNTAVGFSALYNCAGKQNTAVGRSALVSSTTGSYNSALGDLAGFNSTALTTGIKNTFLGASTGFNGDQFTNSTAIGYGALISRNNQVVVGDGNVLDIYSPVAMFDGGRQAVLTSGTTQTLFWVSCPNTNCISGKVLWTVNATDGTEAQAQNGDTLFTAVAKATAVTAAVQSITNSAAVSGGSLTVAFNANTATNNVIAIQAAATTSLTTTNLVIKWRITTPSTYAVNVL